MVLRRWLSLSLSALFLAAPLLAAHHRANARHGHCPEHGSPIHLDPGHLPEAAHAPGDVALERDERVHARHDCAALAFLSHCSSLARAVGPGRAASTLEPLAAIVAARAALPAIPLLRQSPKQSPPRERC